MKKTISIVLLSILVRAAACAADATLPDLAAIRPAGDVVTSLPPAPPVPDDVRTNFTARLDAAKRLVASGSFDEARAAYDAIAKDFANHPRLARSAGMERIYGLRNAKAWDARELPVLDAIVTSPDLLTRDAFIFLVYRFNLADQLRRHDLSNDSYLRLLALPGLSTNDACRFKTFFVKNLGGPLERPADAVAVAEGLLGDPSLTESARREIAAYAAGLAFGALGDPARAEAIYGALLARPLAPGDRIAATDLLAAHFEKLGGTNAFARAEALDKAIADNPENPADQRARHVERILLRYRHRLPRATWRGAIDWAAGFVETNSASLSREGIGLIRGRMLVLAEDGGLDCARGIAELLADDDGAPAWARVGGAIRLSTEMLGEGDLDGAEKPLRSALASGGLTAGLVAKLVGQLGRVFIARNDLDGAIACYEGAYALDPSPAMTNAVVPLVGKAYAAFFREKEGVAYCERRGFYLAAAKLCRSSTYRDDAEAVRLYRLALADTKRSSDERREAYAKLLKDDSALCDRYYDFFVTGNAVTTNLAVRDFGAAITAYDDGYGLYGDYDGILRVYEKYLRPLLDADRRPTDYAVARYVLAAYSAFGRFADAAEVARHVVETSPKLAPAERYHLLLAADALPLEGDAAKLRAAVARLDARLAGDVPPAERVKMIQRVGCTAMVGNREDLVRALEDYRKSLYVPQPRKRYVVRFSERPVLGPESWGLLPFKPEEQPMDRAFGGSMEFLTTDVATGNRGEGVGTGEADKAVPPPTLSVVADVQGLHFRFVAPHPRAREVEARQLEGGSYEGYIAPGANQPYVCFLARMTTGSFSFFNTAYDSPNHRRVNTEDHDLYRAQFAYSDDAITTYFMLSWNAYVTLVPENGTVWEFENINWRRPGNACWNGTESIHGRSTWGELVFDLPGKARAAILRHVLYKAVADYKAEKRTSQTREGILEHWSDPGVGDPAFYAECLAPLVERLDGYAARVSPEMSDADAVDVAENALKEMHDLRFVVERLRARYLRKRLK